MRRHRPATTAAAPRYFSPISKSWHAASACKTSNNLDSQPFEDGGPRLWLYAFNGLKMCAPHISSGGVMQLSCLTLRTVSFAVIVLASTAAFAQTFPNKPIRIVLGPPRSGDDFTT